MYNIWLETNTHSCSGLENLVASDCSFEIGSAGIFFGVCVAQPQRYSSKMKEMNKFNILLICLITILSTCCRRVDHLQFLNSQELEIDFQYSSFDDPYLTELRQTFELDSIVSTAVTDLEKARLICDWVHSLWEHDGVNIPQNNDPISIITLCCTQLQLQSSLAGLCGAILGYGMSCIRRAGICTIPIDTYRILKIGETVKNGDARSLKQPYW